MPEGDDPISRLAHELAWAASPLNKDPEIRAGAKEILDKLCMLQMLRASKSSTRNKRIQIKQREKAL